MLTSSRPPILPRLLLLAAVALAGCSGHHTRSTPVPMRQESRAQRSAPTAALQYLVAVAQTKNPPTRIKMHPTDQMGCVRYEGTGGAALAGLKRALLESGEFALLDYGSADSLVSSLKQVVPLPQQRGPYLIRASLTEYVDLVEKTSSSLGGPIQHGDSLVEASLKLAAMIPLFWINQITLLPTEYEQALSRGAVALDVEVYDPKQQRILGAFVARGSYSEASSSLGQVHAGGVSSSSNARSVFDEALALAVSDAAQRVAKIVSQ